ncbi:hypothetical protein GCM10027346_38510 [Hymenobacter seoulensis]
MKPSFLVVTDLSPRAQRAAWYAALLASATEGQVVLIPLAPALPAEPELGAAAMSAEYLLQEQTAQTALQQLAEELPAPAVVEETVEGVAAVLTKLVSRWQPAVLVLGTVAEHNLADTIWFNQVLPALRDSGLPVLLVPEEANPDPRLPQLVAIAADGKDFQLTEGAAVAPALLSSWPTAFSVVHVAPPGGLGVKRAVAAVYRSGLVPPSIHCLPYEVQRQSCSNGIVQAALDIQADLLVLLTRPRSLVSSMVGGGVAAHVVRSCLVPTLLLPIAEVPAPALKPKSVDGLTYFYSLLAGAGLAGVAGATMARA